MSNYRRTIQYGGCFFFTLVTYKRIRIFDDENNIALLRNAFKKIKSSYPFHIDGIVILPDHLHSMWTLPETDHDFSTRWRLIKSYVSRHLDIEKNHRGEKLIWQRRFWEHTIRDETDYQRHLDYIHYNPVKHNCTKNPADWLHSSFHKALKNGLYDSDWGTNEPNSIADMDYE